MTMIVRLYDGVKYDPKSEKVRDIEYTGVKGFMVVTGSQIEEYLKGTDGTCIDEYDEYLILYFENGEESTFRNSHVDLFKKF